MSSKKQQHNRKLSKKLSYLLRHGAEKQNVAIDAGGYVSVSAILALPTFSQYSFDEIEKVVQQNDKQRFKLTQIDDHWVIRANQGHTIVTVEDDQLLTLDDQHIVCVHGTSMCNWQKIKKSQGLSRMNRNHIHFATTGENVISGMRANSEVKIFIDMPKAREDGISFYLSSNSVILSSGIDGILPQKYFSHVIRVADDHILYQND